MFSKIVNSFDELKQAFTEAYEIARSEINRGDLVVLTLAHKTRSNEQNSKMWAMLGDVSRQVDWYGQKLTNDEWKDVFTAALRKEKVVPGIEGGFVVLGRSTSRMSIREMKELTDLIEAFGGQQGVRFTAPKWMTEE